MTEFPAFLLHHSAVDTWTECNIVSIVLGELAFLP